MPLGMPKSNLNDLYFLQYASGVVGMEMELWSIGNRVEIRREVK